MKTISCVIGLVLLACYDQTNGTGDSALSHLKYHTAWVFLGKVDAATKEWATGKMFDVLRPGASANGVRMPTRGDRLRCEHAQQLAITDFGRDGEAKRLVRPTSGKVSSKDLVGMLRGGEVVDVCEVSIEPARADPPRLEGVWVRVGDCK